MDAKQPRHEEALSGVTASRAHLMNEAESRRKETAPSTFTTTTQGGLRSGDKDSVAECQTRPSHERSGAMGEVGAGEHRSSGKS